MSRADQETIRSLVGRLPDPVLEPQRTALVVVDLQLLDAAADGAHGVRAREMGMWDELEEYFERCAGVVVPATRRVADALRAAGGMIVWVRCEARSPTRRTRAVGSGRSTSSSRPATRRPRCSRGSATSPRTSSSARPRPARSSRPT